MWIVLGEHRAAASRQRRPFRITKMMPLMIRRSSTRGTHATAQNTARSEASAPPKARSDVSWRRLLGLTLNQPLVHQANNLTGSEPRSTNPGKFYLLTSRHSYQKMRSSCQGVIGNGHHAIVYARHRASSFDQLNARFDHPKIWAVQARAHIYLRQRMRPRRVERVNYAGCRNPRV